MCTPSASYANGNASQIFPRNKKTQTRLFLFVPQNHTSSDHTKDYKLNLKPPDSVSHAPRTPPVHTSFSPFPTANGRKQTQNSQDQTNREEVGAHILTNRGFGPCTAARLWHLYPNGPNTSSYLTPPTDITHQQKATNIRRPHPPKDPTTCTQLPRNFPATSTQLPRNFLATSLQFPFLPPLASFPLILLQLTNKTPPHHKGMKES